MPTKPTWDDVVDKPTWDDVIDKPGSQSRSGYVIEAPEMMPLQAPVSFASKSPYIPKIHDLINVPEAAEAAEQQRLANRKTKADLAEEQKAIADQPSWHKDPTPEGGFEMDYRVGDTPGSFSEWDQRASMADLPINLAKQTAKGSGHILEAFGNLMANQLTVGESGYIDDESLKEWNRRLKMTPEQRAFEAQKDPFVIAGQAQVQAADEFYGVKRPDSLASRVGETVGGFFPAVLTGPLAPLTFGFQAAGAVLESKYQEEIDKGTPEGEALAIARKAALKEGSFQAAFMKIYPHQAKKLGDAAINKMLGDQIDRTFVNGLARFAGGLVANVIEGAGFGWGSQMGSNLLQGRPLTENVRESMEGMAEIMLFLRRGPTKQEASRAKAEYGEIAQEVARIRKAKDENRVRPEHREILDESIAKSGSAVEPAELPEGMISTIDRNTGSILLDRRQLAEELAHIPEEVQKKRLIESITSEESVHLATPKPKALQFYLDSSLEDRLLAGLRYYGAKGFRSRLFELYKLGDKAEWDRFKTNMGYEMINMKVKEAKKWTQHDIEQTKGDDYSKMKALVNLQKWAWDLRSGWNDFWVLKGPSRINNQKAILGQVIENVDRSIAKAKENEAAWKEYQAKEAAEQKYSLRARLLELKAKKEAEIAKKAVAPEPAPAPAPAPVAASPAPAPAATGGRVELDSSGYGGDTITKFDAQGNAITKPRVIDPDNEPFARNKKDSQGPAAWSKGHDSSDISKLKPEEFFNLGKSWNLEKMNTGQGLSVQGRAEVYAMREQDLPKWKQLSDQANADAEKLRNEVKENPSLLLNPEFQKKYMGTAQKSQFFNEGVAMLDGSKPPSAEALKNLKEWTESGEDQAGQGPAAYYKGMSRKQFLVEKDRQLKAAFLKTKGEEVPPHLAQAGMPKGTGGEQQPVPVEERVSTGYNIPNVQDVRELAYEELGSDIKETTRVRKYEAQPTKKWAPPEDYVDLETGKIHYEKQAKTIKEYDRPNYDRFLTRIKESGSPLTNEQILEIWTDRVWSMLIKAPPSRLAKMREALGLEGKYGRRSMGEDPLGKSDVPEYSEPQKAEDITVASQRRRAVLEKRIDKLEAEAKRKLKEADEWEDKISDAEKLKAKDELFGPTARGQALRKQATDLQQQVWQLRYALSKASPETLAAAYAKTERQPVQQPLGSITDHAKAVAKERSSALLKEAATATPERIKEIDAELQRLAQMINRAERIKESSGPDTPAERSGEAGVSARSYRNKVVRAIAHQLIGEAFRATKEKADINRRSIDIEDLDFNNKKTKAKVYYKFTPGDLDMKPGDEDVSYFMSTVLKDQARGKNTDLESASRRVLVVEDVSDGTIHLLSVYKDGKVWRVTDPAFKGEHKPYREMNQLFLKKHKPISSMLLKDPVKGLSQTFDTLDHFMDKIGKEAKERSDIGDSYQDLFVENYFYTPKEGTPGIEGEMGSFQGPKKGYMDPKSRNPMLISKTPLSRNEAFAISRYKTRLDVMKRIEQLRQKVEYKEKLTQKDMLEMSGFRKISQELQRGRLMDPELTSDPAETFYDLIEEVGNAIANSQGYQSPVKSLLLDYGWNRLKTEKARMWEKEYDAIDAKSSLTKRDLEMRGDIRPPTSQREFAGPFQRAEPPPVEIGVKESRPYIPESVSSEPPIQTEAESYSGRKYDVTMDWAAAYHNKMAEQESLRNKAMKMRERIFRKHGKLLTKQEAAYIAEYTGPMAYRKISDSQRRWNAIDKRVGFVRTVTGTPTPGSMYGSHNPIDLVMAVSDGKKPVAIFDREPQWIPENTELRRLNIKCPHGDEWAVIKKGNEDAINALEVALAQRGPESSDAIGKALGYTKAERDDFRVRSALIGEWVKEHGEDSLFEDSRQMDLFNPDQMEFPFADGPGAYRKGKPDYSQMPENSKDYRNILWGGFSHVSSQNNPTKLLREAKEFTEYLDKVLGQKKEQLELELSKDNLDNANDPKIAELKEDIRLGKIVLRDLDDWTRDSKVEQENSDWYHDPKKTFQGEMDKAEGGDLYRTSELEQEMMDEYSPPSEKEIELKRAEWNEQAYLKYGRMPKDQLEKSLRDGRARIDRIYDLFIKGDESPENIKKFEKNTIDDRGDYDAMVRAWNDRLGGDQQSFPAAHRKKSDRIYNMVSGFGSWFDEPLIQAMERHGGDVSRDGAKVLRKIQEDYRKYRGELSQSLDPATIAATGSRIVPVIGQTPTPAAMKAANWANSLFRIPGTAGFAATPSWMWSLSNPGFTVPTFAQRLMSLVGIANLSMGKLFEGLGTKFLASGKPQQNLTWEGFATFNDVGGEMWRRWTTAVYQANKDVVKNLTLADVREQFRNFKELMDKPDITGSLLKKVNQDFNRRFPSPVTHIKHNGMWHELIHANLFGYLQRGADRAAYTRAFREQFPNTKEGRAKLIDFREGIVNELKRDSVEEFDQVLMRIQGRPDFNYQNLPFLKPTNIGGQAFRILDATVGNLMAKSVLSGQMVLQPAELMAGATTVFLGYKNTLEAARRLMPGSNPAKWIKDMAKSRQLYSEAEKFGQVNPVMLDFAAHEGSAIRSASKITGNVISKVFMEHMLNEWQETLAATTANVVADKISIGALSKWELRMMPRTFKAMGFNEAEVKDLMKGDKDLLDQFRRKAASFLTGGNRSLVDASRLASNPHFNTMFRFMTYPQVRINQFRQVTKDLVQAWQSGTPQDKLHSTEMWTRNVVGPINQGILTSVIGAMAYGGLSGVSMLLNEGKDKPIRWLFDSFMMSAMGPLHQLSRSYEEKGWRGLARGAARMAFPVSTAEDIMEFGSRSGRYKDMEWSRAIRTFLMNKNPGLRAAQTGAALVGLSQRDLELDAAIKGYGKWKRDKFGILTVDDHLKLDENKRFRMAIAKSVDAFRKGDEKAFYNAYDEAVDIRSEDNIEETIKERFNARTVFRNATNGKLDEDEMEELRKRIGDKAMEKLEDYNWMLREAGKGLFIPMDER